MKNLIMTVGLILPAIFFAMEDPRAAVGFAGASLPSVQGEVVINVAQEPLRPMGPVEQRVRQRLGYGNRHVVDQLGFTVRRHRRSKKDVAILKVAKAIDRGNAAREQERMEQAKDARWALARDWVTFGLGVVGSIAGLYSTFR